MRVGSGAGPEERAGKPGRQSRPEMAYVGSLPGGLGMILAAAAVVSLLAALLAFVLR